MAVRDEAVRFRSSPYINSHYGTNQTADYVFKPRTRVSYIFREEVPDMDLNHCEQLECILPWNAPDDCKNKIAEN